MEGHLSVRFEVKVEFELIEVDNDRLLSSFNHLASPETILGKKGL